MTIREIIDNADATKPNDFSLAAKIRWIAELDGQIALNIMMMSIEDVKRFRYTEDDVDAEPLVEFPHDNIYEQYLAAKIDYANGEYSKYQNSSAMFNALYQDFLRWFANTYDPVQDDEEEEAEE